MLDGASLAAEVCFDQAEMEAILGIEGFGCDITTPGGIWAGCHGASGPPLDALLVVCARLAGAVIRRRRAACVVSPGAAAGGDESARPRRRYRCR